MNGQRDKGLAGERTVDRPMGGWAELPVFFFNRGRKPRKSGLQMYSFHTTTTLALERRQVSLLPSAGHPRVLQLGRKADRANADPWWSP